MIGTEPLASEHGDEANFGRNDLTRGSLATRLAQAQAGLRRRTRSSVREGYPRDAIPSEHALGVAMRDIQSLARSLGRDHEPALALWDTRSAKRACSPPA